ncbi:MAG: hypothetical protein Q8903_15515 [Bacteroidota bacterium]|nr:hypothetical protein [Bacteroidota bacterium]
MSSIYLAPVRFSNLSLLNIIKNNLIRIFNKAEIKTIDLEIDPQFAKSVERNQYHSTKILAEAMKKTDPFDGKVILLADFDLFVPVFTFVYGEAQLNGKHSIVSISRLHEEIYTGITDEALLLQRSLKEILHEFGHNLGLLHCKDWNCVMHSSGRIEEVDIKGDFYCKTCQKDANIDQLQA